MSVVRPWLPDMINSESRVQRPVHIPDTRVHICLYFIAPTGHGLKPIDIEFMRRLHDKGWFSPPIRAVHCFPLVRNKPFIF